MKIIHQQLHEDDISKITYAMYENNTIHGIFSDSFLALLETLILKKFWSWWNSGMKILAGMLFKLFD